MLCSADWIDFGTSSAVDKRFTFEATALRDGKHRGASRGKAAALVATIDAALECAMQRNVDK